MKRVKLQPTQHTIILSDEELEHILVALTYYTEQDHTSEDEEIRSNIFTGHNPVYEMYAHLMNEISIKYLNNQDSNVSVWDN